MLEWRARWGQEPPSRLQAWGQLSGLKRTAVNDECLIVTDVDKKKIWLASPVLISEFVCQKLAERRGVDEEESYWEHPWGRWHQVVQCPSGSPLFHPSKKFGLSPEIWFLFFPAFAQRVRLQSLEVIKSRRDEWVWCTRSFVSAKQFLPKT